MSFFYSKFYLPLYLLKQSSNILILR